MEQAHGVSMTSEMAFTESLLLRKGHFLSRKRGRLFEKYIFRSLNGAFKPRKKGTFFTFKKGGGAHAPIAPPPPVPRPLLLYFCIRAKTYITKFLKAIIFLSNNPEIP
jgi:hypothetical protein